MAQWLGPISRSCTRNSHDLHSNDVHRSGTWLPRYGSGTRRSKAGKELVLDTGRESKNRSVCEWLAFSPNGERLAARFGPVEGKTWITAWHRHDWKAVSWDFNAFDPSLMRNSLCAFDLKSERLYFSSLGSVQAYDFKTGKALGFTDTERKPQTGSSLDSLSISRDGETLVLTRNLGRSLLISTCPTHASSYPVKLTKLVVVIRDQKNGIAINDDQSMIMVAYSEGEMRETYSFEVIRTKSAEVVFRQSALRGCVWTGKFSPDSKILATGGEDGTLAVWNAQTGKFLRSVTEVYGIYSIEFFPGKNWIVFSSRDADKNAFVRFVDLDSGKILCSLEEGTKHGLRLCLSPDGKILATVGGNGVVQIWDVAQLIREK